MSEHESDEGFEGVYVDELSVDKRSELSILSTNVSNSLSSIS